MTNRETGGLCADGIVWTNGRAKGPELRQLLTHLQSTATEANATSAFAVATIGAPLPTRIVFVDDLLHNVESVRDVCGPLLPIHGYHYIPRLATSRGDNADGSVGADTRRHAGDPFVPQVRLADAPILAPFRTLAHRLAADRRDGAAITASEVPPSRLATSSLSISPSSPSSPSSSSSPRNIVLSPRPHRRASPPTPSPPSFATHADVSVLVAAPTATTATTAATVVPTWSGPSRAVPPESVLTRISRPQKTSASPRPFR
jgi:hypothetical protein